MRTAMRHCRAARTMLVRGVLVLLLFAAASTPALAQSCYVSGAFGLNFGEVTAAGKAANSSITYTCAPDYSGGRTTYYYQLCLYLEPGNWSIGQTTRRMSNYNNVFLRYDLFADPAHTQLIGGLGSFPIYRLQLQVSPGAPETRHAQVHGRVYPGQSVPALVGFQEQGIIGVLRWRYDTTGFPQAEDCTTGGTGGGATGFNSSGVLATFQNSCTINASDLDFGRVTPSERGAQAQADIRVQCPANTAWCIGLDLGQHSVAGERRMAGPSGEYLDYELYRDPGRTESWGDIPGEMAAGQTDAQGTHLNVTVYGYVPAQPDAVPGAYRDQVVATIYY